MPTLSPGDVYLAINKSLHTGTFTANEVQELLQMQAGMTYDSMHAGVVTTLNENEREELKREGAEGLRRSIITKLGLGIT